MHVQNASLEDDIRWEREDIEAWYKEKLDPLQLTVSTRNTSLQTYTWAFAIVVSRTFAMPANSELKGHDAGALIPVMDMCSHDPNSTCEQNFNKQVCRTAHHFD